AAVPHGGGQRFKKGSAEYNILERWMAEGAPGIDPKLSVTDVQVSPAERVIPKPKLLQQIRVTACYSAGSTRDVTRCARFSSNDDPGAAGKHATGLVKTQQGGDCAVMISYSGFVKGARSLVRVGGDDGRRETGAGRRGTGDGGFGPRSASSFIDELV